MVTLHNLKYDTIRLWKAHSEKIWNLAIVTMVFFALAWIIKLKEPSDKIAATVLVGGTTTSLIVNKKSVGEDDITLESQPGLKLFAQSAYRGLPVEKINEKVVSKLPKSTQEKVRAFNDLLDSYRSHVDYCQELADYLDDVANRNLLVDLTRKAGRYALQHASRHEIEDDNLNQKKQQDKFFEDIYLYLKIWLVNSIRYDVDLEERCLSITHKSLYCKAFEFLQREKLETFLSCGKGFTAPASELESILGNHLNILVEYMKS